MITIYLLGSQNLSLTIGYIILTFLNYVSSLQLGLGAVPKKILELMDVPGLTRENVASHLQVWSSSLWALDVMLPFLFRVELNKNSDVLRLLRCSAIIIISIKCKKDFRGIYLYDFLSPQESHIAIV